MSIEATKEELENLKLKAEIDKIRAEQEKIEIEKQKVLSDKSQQEKFLLRQPSFYSSILNSFITVLIPSLTILAGYFLGGGEQFIEAQKAVLEAQKAVLENKKEILDNEENAVQGRISVDSLRQKGLDSTNAYLILSNYNLQKNDSILREDKTRLMDNISDIKSQSLILGKELGFAFIKMDLSELKRFYYPNNFSDELIAEIRNDNIYTKRTIDSLICFTHNDYLKNISWFILYSGTKEEKYRDSIFSNIPIAFKLLRDSDCFSSEYSQLLSNCQWSLEDKGRISKIILKNYHVIRNNCGRESVLNIIADYKFCNDIFALSEIDYNSYWEYLRFIRDMATSDDPHINKTEVLTNALLFSPELFFSLYAKSMSREYTREYGDNIIQNHNLLYSFVEIYLTAYKTLPAHIFQDLASFSDENHIVNNAMPCDSDYYIKHKSSIDAWLIGDFPKYKNDSAAFVKCIEACSF